jgi:hypothetical protein
MTSTFFCSTSAMRFSPVLFCGCNSFIAKGPF